MSAPYTIAHYRITARLGEGGVHQWSPTGIIGTGAFQNFDIFPDGKRAILVALSDRYSGGATGQHATFIVNFFDEVKRRLP